MPGWERRGAVMEKDWEEGRESRNPKDKKINKEGRVLLRKIEEVG